MTDFLFFVCVVAGVGCVVMMVSALKMDLDGDE